MNSKKKKNVNQRNNTMISQETMTDPRFQKAFNDPSFRAVPKRRKNGNKVQIDSRFESMFNDPAFKTGYRIDRYGREINNNEAYDLHKFYELQKKDDSKNGDHQNNTNNKNEGYEAEHEEEEEEENDGEKDEQSQKSTLSKNMQKQIAKIKSQKDDEIDENDPFWDQWDKKKDDKKSNILSSKESKLLHRKAGNMFDYDADSTSSSSESEYDYNKLTVDDVGEDARAVLDDHKNENDSPPDCEPSTRLAVVNCDWENLHAHDLYMIFRSFLPPQGSIVKISIHPSKYGVEMMKKEEQFGPDKNIWNEGTLPTEVKDMEHAANFIADNEENENENDVNQDYDEDEQEEDYEEEEEEEFDEKTQELHEEMSRLEKLEETIKAIKQGRAGDVLEDEVDTVYNKQALRKYELQKLRYYYAIAEFDSVNTADRLYQELNNREFRHTCNVLSLSFVDTDFVAPFDATDVCTDLPENYIAASDKQTNALGSTFVELTWDQTDPNRVEQCQRSFTEDQLNKMDLDAYLQDDDAITDAGFDTDYPVTEYDTDTPDKKVLIKRRARNRYKEILSEFNEMEQKIQGSDESMSGESETDREEFNFNCTDKESNSDDDEDDDINVNNDITAMQHRLQQKQLKEMNRIKQAQMNVDNLSSSDEDEEDNVIDGDQEDTFNYDDEVTAMNSWIETQQQLKDTINKVQKERNLEVNPKKRSRDEYEQDEEDENSEDEPLVQDDMDPELMDDPYFKDVHDSTYMDIDNTPKHGKKKQKMNDDDDKIDTKEDEQKKQIERRAMLEMMIASNNDDIKYDPENNEIDIQELSKNLDKRLKRNWRLRWLIKKAVKRKLAQQDEFEYNHKDERFDALHDDPSFAIDPTNTSFRNTKIMNNLLEKTRAKRLNKWNNKNNKNKWNKKLNNKNRNIQSASSIDTSSLIESLKTKSSKIPKLQNTQLHRKNITKKIKEKGLSSFE